MENTSRRRTAINLIAALFSFFVTIGINFFLTPFLVGRLGTEAYGFIGLSNNFISYASLLTIALNSMAGRHISVAYHQDEFEKVNTYYSSVFIANIILSAVIIIASVFLISNINALINVPDDLVTDVKITFAAVFLNLIIQVFSSTFNVAAFIKNRLDLPSLATIGSNILRVLVIIPLFVFLPPKIYYISMGVLTGSVFLGSCTCILARKLLPEIKIRYGNFKMSAVRFLIASGSWNSFNTLSQILLTGLDLLIANLLIGGTAMGTLSIAKTIPFAIVTLASTIGGVFTPQFTALFARDENSELVKAARFSIKILSCIMTVPIAGFIAFGTAFYTLWLPGKALSEIMEIQILSVITLGPYIFSSYIFSLYSINTATNKLKVPVLILFAISLVSLLCVFIALKTTNLGLYAIAGVSSVFLTLRTLVFVPVYAAHNLKQKLTVFYPTLLKAIGCFAVILLCYTGIEALIQIRSWGQLVFTGLLAGALGYVISFFMILNKAERNKAIQLVAGRLRRNR